MPATPEDPKAIWRRAIGLYDAGNFEESHKLLNFLRKLMPRHPPLLHLLGVSAFRTGRREEGLALLRQALTAAPSLAPALADLGNLLAESGAADEARDLYRRAVAADPAYVPAIINLAQRLASDGDTAEATSLLDAALARMPAAHDLRWTRSLIALSLGDLAAGWRDYAVRWQLPRALFDSPRHDLGLPPQKIGEKPAAEPVWIWPEQGIGDQILHASAIPEAVRRDWHLYPGCSPRALSLFRRSFPALPVLPVDSNDTDAAKTICTRQMPAADLFAAVHADLPINAPRDAFLTADAASVAALQRRYREMAPHCRLVGLSWRSHNRFSAREKSIAPDALAPLMQIPGVAYVCLQYGDTADDIARLRQLGPAPVIMDSQVDPLGDLDPFAAQIAALDAVISVSNTTVHLSGALGVPTIVMLPRHIGLMWYWFRSGDRSPWYPRVWLARQDHIDDWSGPVAAAARRLEEIVTQSGE